MRLLLVDDDPIFLEELSELLAGEGHTVATAPSALSALDRLAKERFDLLLTDLKMPRHSGTHLLKAVRSRWPSLLTILLTGQAREVTALEALDLEAFNYISKPFRFDWVRSTVDLAAQEIAFRDRLCGPRSLTEARAELDGAPPGARVVLGANGADGITAPIARPLDLADPETLGRDLAKALEGHPSPRVLLLAPAERVRVPGPEALARAAASVARAIGPGGRLLLGVDRDSLSDSHLIALRWTLADRVARPAQASLAGPQRRAMIRCLGEGPLDSETLAGRTGVIGADRIRFYLQYLAQGGLIRWDEPRVELTELGRSALRFLGEVERSGPRTPSGDLLFGLAASGEESRVLPTP